MSQHTIVALAYDQLCTFEFGCVVEVFALERPELQVDWYRFAVCSADEGKIRAAGGITFVAPYTLSMLDKADTIIIPGWRNIHERPPEKLLKKIRTAYQRGTRICTICSGIFVLAAAGVLTGKRVTTHWRYTDELKKQFPDMIVEPDALYVDDGQIISSAGSAAGLDMMLHIIRKDYNVGIANLVAKRLVIPPHREGGQSQFAARPIADDERHRISDLLSWIRQHPQLPHSLASLANIAAMSERSLQRQFVQLTTYSPYDWIIRERVSICKELLESSNNSLSRIAELAGFGSEESLRRHFKRIVGTSPIAYRRQFKLT